jgi:hypothetical protein
VALKTGDETAARSYAADARVSGRGVLVEADLAVAQKDFRRPTRSTGGSSAGQLPRRAMAGCRPGWPIVRRHGSPGRSGAGVQPHRVAIERFRAALQQDTFDFLVCSSLTDFHGSYAAFLIDRGRAAEALAVVDHARGRVLWERVRAQQAEARPSAASKP